MMNRIVTVAIALAVSTAIGLSSPADAGTLRHRDPKSDVYADNDSGNDPRLPAHSDGDITAFRLSLTKRHFAATAHFRALSLPVTKFGEDTSHNFNFNLVSRNGATANVTFTDFRRKPTVMVQLPASSGNCGVGRVNYRTATIHLVVPSRCLGNPRWVRVRFFTQSYDDIHLPSRGYLDSGFNAHGLVGSKLSRRIHRD